MIKALQIFQLMVGMLIFTVAFDTTLTDIDVLTISAEETEVEIENKNNQLASSGYTYEKTTASDGGKDYHAEATSFQPSELISFISDEENRATLTTEKNAQHHSPFYILYCSLKIAMA